MSSLKSFFRKKKHKYGTQADLKDMTAEQIVSLNPSDVGSYIENETGGVPLTGVKKRAMFNLLAQKRIEKESGANPVARERAIENFLQREGLINDPEVTDLVAKTTSKVMIDKVKEKEMQNRFKRLKNEPEIPYTEEEQRYLRLSKLNTGGKTKRRRRHRTKKRKSHRKRHTYRKK